MHKARHASHHAPFQGVVSDEIQREVRHALHDWRTHMSSGSELTEPIDAERDHIRGDTSASVVVVEYGALGSAGESKEDRVVREQLRDLLGAGRIRLAFRHFPIIDSHPGAWLAAKAVEAADRQGRFWDLHEALTDSFALPVVKEFDGAELSHLARRLKLDVDQLERDINDPAISARILRDLESGFASGVNGAPTFYVQGVRQDIDAVDELLERVERALEGDLGALWPPVHTGAI